MRPSQKPERAGWLQAASSALRLFLLPPASAAMTRGALPELAQLRRQREKRCSCCHEKRISLAGWSGPDWPQTQASACHNQETRGGFVLLIVGKHWLLPRSKENHNRISSTRSKHQ